MRLDRIHLSEGYRAPQRETRMTGMHIDSISRLFGGYEAL
jgi:hypothetical protein